jgi:predicted RNA binding protein YcfA (HicA-like mRNA interferase family)
MKRQELLKILSRMGAVFVRHGSKHDVYLQPVTNIETTVPRHEEIKKFTAKGIINTLSNFEEKKHGVL